MSPIPAADDSLRALRTRAGITQAALAELVGTDEATIAAIESGEAAPDDVCTRIAQMLNVSIELVVSGQKGNEATDPEANGAVAG